MKIKNIIALFIAVTFVITGCKDKKKSKTQNSEKEVFDKGYTLQKFIGDDNNEYSITFNTNPKIPTAFIKTKDFKKMLSQKQVWAKGAEYESNKIKLIAKGNKAILFVNDKKIELKEK